MLEKLTKEYRTYKTVEHWKPQNEVLLVKDLTNPRRKLGKLFSYLYHKTKKEYKHFPKRKDGTDPFIHPLNLVWSLRKAGINDIITLSAAIVHDLIEEGVDLYKKEKNIKEDSQGIKTLDEYEVKTMQKLENELNKFCNDNKINQNVVKEMIEILKLLTRHKRDLYYRSISSIFIHKDDQIKEKAIQIKLADRIHNIQSLKSYDEQGRIYQSFKNLFIINNTKNYLIKKYGKEANRDREKDPLTKMFKKCAKATYDAFSKVCDICFHKGIEDITSMLQLAFRKFVHEKKGLWTVTKIDSKETHPLRLYQGIVRKYDARLHQEWKKFEKMKKDEMNYVRKFFAEHKFSKEQLQAVLDYKDSYALKEVIARMLYKRNYVILNFGCSELCSRGQICMKS
jgi:hypothetical protein